MAKRGQGAFEYILLLAGVLLIVVLAIIILRGTLTNNKEGARAQCLASIAKAPCYLADGSWNVTTSTTDPTGFLADDWGIDKTKCLTDATTSALASTTWRVDATHFRCGPKPA